MTSVFAKFVRDRRRSVIGYSVGIAALISWVAAVFPILRDSDAFSEFVDNFPPQMLAVFGIDPETFLTAAGYLQAQFYSLFGPLLVLFFAVGAAANATAGEERDGTMDMLLSEPVSRRSVMFQNVVGIGVATLAIVITLGVALLALNPLFDLGLPVVAIVAANGALWLLAALFGAVALAAGAFTGKPAVARGFTGGLAFTAWLVNAFASLYSWLEGPAAISPFTWYLDVDPLVGGLSLGHLWLAGVTAGFTVLALVFFSRRDIATEKVVLPGKASRWLNRSAHRDPRAVWLLTTVCRKSLWDRRRSIWGWLGGLSVLLLVTFAAWPALSRDADALQELITALPREVFAMFGMSDPAALATPAGFISSRSYLSVGPIIIVLFTIGSVSTTVIREERSGLLDLVLSNPLARRAVIVGKAIAITISTSFLMAALMVLALVGNIVWDTGLSVANVVAANVGLALLGMCFAGLALGLWALQVTSMPATRLAGGIAVATFFFNGLGSLTDTLSPLRLVSPFYWYLGDVPPLAKAFQPSYLLLFGVAAAGIWIAATRFDSRDLAV